MKRLPADFNGLFGRVLCLSHRDSEKDADGNEVTLADGMQVLAFEEDPEVDGTQAYLVAIGTVRPAPPELACNGSKWVLEIDSNGVKHQPSLQTPVTSLQS